MDDSGARLFDHTADVGIEAWGPTLEAALAAAAREMFTYLCDVARVEERIEVALEARGADDAERAVHFLQEALAAWHGRRLLLARFEVEPVRGEVVRGRARGEAFDPARHEVYGEVKAVTYHQARVEREGSRHRIEVVLDI
jgi:SHS2 domain-containing protein